MSWRVARRLLSAGLTVCMSLNRSRPSRDRLVADWLRPALAAAVLVADLKAMAVALADEELQAAVAAAEMALADGRFETVERAFTELLQTLMDSTDPYQSTGDMANTRRKR
jgi:hypothetical protein